MKFCSLFLLAFLLSQSDQHVERQIYAMGTVLQVTSLEPDRERAIAEIESIFQAIEETEDQLSIWRPSSELSKLNGFPTGVPFSATDSLLSVLQSTDRWVKETNGAFEPTVGHSIMGFSNLQLDLSRKTVTKIKAVNVDSGGFGKGEALDRAAKVAQEGNYSSLLLNFGGQIAAVGATPNDPWKVSIAIPSRREIPSSITATLKHGSFSTSGQSERPGHILDPTNGRPVFDFGSVTVWHSQALVADILSTALYVMGPEKGYQWSVEHDVAACFVILSSNGTETRKTPAFERL